MSHNIRSRTYMQVASRERNLRTQAIQTALALLVLVMLVITSQIARRVDAYEADVQQPASTVTVQQPTWGGMD